MNGPLVHRRSGTANRPITRVMVLVANGVSMTTVSATLEPFHQANTQLRCNRFNLQLVSFYNDDPVTQVGIPVPCHASSKEVLARHDIADQPDLVILCCGQLMDPNEQALMQKFTRKLVRACVPVFALGAACAAIAAAGLIRGGKCAAHWKTIARLASSSWMWNSKTSCLHQMTRLRAVLASLRRLT
jgi:transcriptional regulator GlxA family with amidase domain